MTDGRLNLVYVCDFASVHSRAFVSYFSERPSRFRVAVVSTSTAPAMKNVELISLAPPAVTSRALRSGSIGRLAQLSADVAPRFRVRARLAEDVRNVTRNQPRIRDLALQLRPHLVHGLRTHPEGVLAWELARTIGQVPLFLSTWGQDLVSWAEGNPRLSDWTGRIMADVDVLLPDNERDAGIARTRHGLNPDARVDVMPATGGLNPRMLDAAVSGDRAPPLDAWPRLLSVRGYQNIYIRTKVLIEAFSLFRESYANAHLTLDGRSGHAGANSHLRWIRRYGVSDSATQVHLTREEMFRHMVHSEMYVSSTLSDGLPISLLEAMYFGQLPVVTRHESVSPPIVEGSNGFTVPSQSAADIASAWARAVRLTPDRDRIMGENRVMISEVFDREKNLDRVARLYAEAVS